jgi:hypothetical protein
VDQVCCTTNYSIPTHTIGSSQTVFALTVATTITVIGASGYFTATTSSLVSEPSPTTNSPSPQASTTTYTASPSKGLSSGAEIGLGAGIGVGALGLILAFVGCVYWQRKKTPKRQRQEVGEQGNAHIGHMSERTGERNLWEAELPGSTIPTLAAYHDPIDKRAELEARDFRRAAELAG